MIPKYFLTSRQNTWVSCVFTLLLVTSLQAASTLETDYRTNGDKVKEAFREIQPALQSGSAVFRRKNRVVIFGTVVSADGYLVTKASELGENPGELEVTVDQQVYQKPKVVATSEQWDVALVKIDAKKLQAVSLSEQGDRPLHRGEWVIANGPVTRKTRRVQIGIIAASERAIPQVKEGILGIFLDAKSKKGVIIGEVVEGSGAEKAGLKKGDEILKIDDTKIENSEELGESFKGKKPGETVELTVSRKEEILTLRVELVDRIEFFGEQQDRNDLMSGEYSLRRTGFPLVFQHDIIANRHYIGGPVIDLNGQFLGMNIARANRCEFYAIPRAELRKLVAELKKESASN